MKVADSSKAADTAAFEAAVGKFGGLLKDLPKEKGARQGAQINHDKECADYNRNGGDVHAPISKSNKECE